MPFGIGGRGGLDRLKMRKFGDSEISAEVLIEIVFLSKRSHRVARKSQGMTTFLCL